MRKTMSHGRIIAVCTSEKRGERKTKQKSGALVKSLGLKGDAHAGYMHRQVSLLAMESIQKMQRKGLEVGPGDFAENLTTEGMVLVSLPVGTRLRAGQEAILMVSQIGKECHDRCAIYEQAGDCVMPREGIFAEVLTGGEIAEGEKLSVVPSYRFGVITASDKGAAGEREDLSGKAIEENLKPLGDVSEYLLVADEMKSLSDAMISMCEKNLDAVFTTGGTGLSPRDVTPEATLAIIQRQVPGIAEAIRRESAAITPRAALSRGVSGIRGQTLIINLPGSPKAVKESLKIISPFLDHALETLTGRSGDCAR